MTIAMKTLWIAIAASGPLLVPVRAGTAPTPPDPPIRSDLWSWFAGGSAGYLTDHDEWMGALSFGATRNGDADGVRHSWFVEVGLTGYDEDFVSAPRLPGARFEEARLEIDIIPITLNYRFDSRIRDRWGFFVGCGLGVAVVDSSYDWSWSQALPPPAQATGGGSDDGSDARLYGHVFAGAAFDLTEKVQLHAGLRWILMDENAGQIDVAGVSDQREGIHNELCIEIGVRWFFD